VGIVDEDVARVRAATDFVQIASEHIALKKVGRRWSGLCPFHAEKSPSFSVNAEEGLYYCFGCSASGDVITFVRNVMHLDFVEAVEFLAGRYGITLRYDDERTGRDRQRKSVLTDAMEKAVDWYHQRLLSGADAGPARSYLRSRGYGRDLVEQFRIGWAPDDWDALTKALRLPEDVLRDTGLGFINRRGRPQDSFRGRVMFPIFDTAGHPVAFGGRILQGSDGPKYKNSPETPIYSKSRTLYGLNWAKTDATTAGEVIVCEGYTDVIAFFQADLPRAVATCGTALADEHFRMLKNFARRIVLAYDADAAGQAAAGRFYEWEQKYEVDIAVAALPAGSDPADVVRDDPALLRKATSEARPFLEFRLDRVLLKGDLRSAEGRARVAEAALTVISEHPSELVRDQYVMRVADVCRIDVNRLRERLASPGRLVVAPTRSRARQHEVGPEIEALRLAVHRPEEVADRLEEVLFEDEVHVAAFRALCEAETLNDAIAAAAPEAAALLQRLAVEDAEAEADDVISLLVQRAATRALGQLQAEARRADDATEFSPTIAWLKHTLEQLREPATSIEAGRQLVPWLVQFGQEGD
jgi:DNA primase